MLAPEMRTPLRGLAGIAVVAAIGFLWAHFGLKRTPGTPPPLNRQASASGLSLRYPAGWLREPDAGGPPLPGAIMLSSDQVAGARLEVGSVSPPGPELPSALRTDLARVPAPQLVVLGGMEYRRYLDAPLAGGRGAASIYLLPTTGGTVTAVCSSDSFSTAFTSACERVLATVRPTGTVLSLRVDAGYALALNRIIDALNAVRRSAGPGLRATRAAARAGAAAALAHADDAAASSIAHITADGVSPGAVSAVNPSLVAALTRSAAAYRALSGAATGRDPGAYALAETAAARAETALGRAFAQLRALGYRVA